MKTNKLPKSAWSGSEAAGSQSPQTSRSSQQYFQKDSLKLGHANKGYLYKDSTLHSGYASNDASYHYDSGNDKSNYENNENVKSNQDGALDYAYKKAQSYQKATKITDIDIVGKVDKKALTMRPSIKSKPLNGRATTIEDNTVNSGTKNHKTTFNLTSEAADTGITEIPERIFMNGLIKHTGIALAIIIPLAAFSAFAATPPIKVAAAAAADKEGAKTLSIKPSDIVYKSATTPTTVDSVDLKKYAGTWYEIGRLPMYFQRNCASDVTATYVEKTDGSGIKVINQCKSEDGSDMTAEGLAKPSDTTGSKLKVTFLPSWIRWLPVGRADYWVLARDNSYKTALVGTPDKKYLWLLARSPNVSQEIYAKYRQIAQQQGYDLKEFKLTTQSNQTVKLVP